MHLLFFAAWSWVLTGVLHIKGGMFEGLIRVAIVARRHGSDGSWPQLSHVDSELVSQLVYAAEHRDWTELNLWHWR